MSQYSYLLLLFVILRFSSSSSISAKVVDVDVICKEASNPSYCSNLLNSKPGGAKNVDLVDLAQYTIGVVKDNLYVPYKLVLKLLSDKNVTVRNYYTRCAIDFDGDDSVRGRLLGAKLDLELKNYPGMASEIGFVMQHIDDCIDSLHKNDTSPLLAKDVDILRQSGEVIQIISKYLTLG
jgi:pectinesterase inhibitor-like protein